jgi:C-terminal processing protease CtpA/Prc
MDFTPSDDNNLKGKHPRRLGFAISHCSARTPHFDFNKHYGCAQVLDVYRGTPAQRAGLRVGDIIVEVEGIPVTKLHGSGLEPMQAVINAIKESNAGVVDITVSREGKTVHVYLEL